MAARTRGFGPMVVVIAAAALLPVIGRGPELLSAQPLPSDGVIREAPIHAPAQAQPTVPPPPPPTPAEVIDWDDAFARLGDTLPDGATLVLGLVEGNAGAYGPDPLHPDLRGVQVTLEAGPSSVSGHAQRTAGTLAGRRGLLPRARQLRVWSVNDWMTTGYLNAGTALPPRFGEGWPRVWSHSWIASDAQRAGPVLRRVDYAIDTHDVIMCVGVNNGRDTRVPPTLAGGYNAIAVGVDTGDSSGGYTGVEGEGRCKPDVVAPGGMTSFATPAVAGCAGILLEQADRMAAGGAGDANRAEVIKAVLMAGAVKHAAWRPQPGKPLDEHLGAGRVNLDKSLRILEGGPVSPGSRVKRAKAWSFVTLPAGETDRYDFQVPRELGAFSVVLTWHRRIEPHPVMLQQEAADERQPLWLGLPRLADLDLRLVRVGDGQTDTTVTQSVSRIDNVEHLYLPALPAGRYRLEVARDPVHDTQGQPWDYALAWRLEPAGEER